MDFPMGFLPPLPKEKHDISMGISPCFPSPTSAASSPAPSRCAWPRAPGAPPRSRAPGVACVPGGVAAAPAAASWSRPGGQGPVGTRWDLGGSRWKAWKESPGIEWIEL